MSDELQGINNEALHASLNALNATMRETRDALGKISAIPTVRSATYNSASHQTPTVYALDLGGRAIRSAYVENGVTALSLQVFAGGSGAGIPLTVVSADTWRRITIPDEVTVVSFTVPALGTGTIRITLSDSSAWQPAMGSIV